MTLDFEGKPGIGLSPFRGRAGFTLVELLLTISIVAILLAMAVPSMEDAALNGKLRSQANALLATLHLARSEAIKRNGRVVVCKSANGTDCVTSGGWQQGWIVFYDRNNDGNRAGDTGEVIIESHQALAIGFVLTNSGSVENLVSFGPSGYAMSTAGGPLSGQETLKLCRAQPSAVNRGRDILISPTGRVRINVVEDCPTT